MRFHRDRTSVPPLELKRLCVRATAVGFTERVAARLTAVGAIRLRVARKVMLLRFICKKGNRERKIKDENKLSFLKKI